jgi:SpoVK/Ycf46/Vps4 family AAA+-type ATPase
MDINKILKFLFPEYQIIESIQKYGFIAKVKPVAPVNQSVTVERTRIQSQTVQSQSQAIPLRKHESITSNSRDKEVFSGKKDTIVGINQLEKSLENAKTSVLNQFIGQQVAIDDLFIAFKRPIVAGVQSDKPKNTFMVIGSEGVGRNSLINTTISALKQENFLNYGTSSKIDLSLYPTQSEKQLFISDIYKALYASTDVIVFKDIEKCHSGMLGVISDLVITGKYKLGARYSMQNNNLIEATGVLMQNSISEITANNKYFIFITHLSESKISDLFTSRFMENVSDIIKFESYTDAEINEISRKMLLNLSIHCRKQMSTVISFSEEFVHFCATKYKKISGFTPVEDYISRHIYKAISEYKLRNTMNDDANILLDYIDGLVCAVMTRQGESKIIDLSRFLPKENTLNIDDVKRELSEVIGLKEVKDYILDLENNLRVQQIREDAGHKIASISMHMIFTGNPGTGKTTIARIVAKYLKAIGILSTGQLREVSRADLVGQYVGHTAKQTNEIIQSALGGVLFIDEAYSLCRDKNDIFGLEAIDALVKAIEDYRDELVVILAGYKDEMEVFLKTNSGLKSRFPNIIDFEDYTASEMVRIAEVIAKSKGYKISFECEDSLLRLFEKSQIKGRNDSGNGRLVRNIIESAIIEQSKRVLNAPRSELALLRQVDFKFDSFEKFDLEKSLSTIIGLGNVKDFVRTQHRLLIANEKRRKAGIMVDSTQSLNMIFTGNPGTGKTTIARVVASLFKDMGLLKKGHLIEIDRRGLVAEYVGQTAKKTEEVFRNALGGVLFIDEAYALSGDNGNFGKEAIDTLVKLIEDYRGEIVVILAGYKNDMATFVKSNAGLESRFPLVIDFPDYNSEDLYQIALNMISKKGFTITEDAKVVLHGQIVLAHKVSSANSGNGRMVRNMVEKIMRNQSARIASIETISREGLTEIIPEDIEVKSTIVNTFDLEKALSPVVGLVDVKNYVRSLHARLRMQSERKKMGLPVDSSQTLHMIFKGNPGTGKTMIARTIADVLYNIGVIKTNKLIETDRSGLVAGYVGQTALKTTEKIHEAMDGVLFIDEAYALAQGGLNDFGREAIDTLVKLMDDNRDRLVVILAGYSKNMDDFILTNPGLKSRFPNIIEFPDYSTDELMTIAENLYSLKGYVLSNDAKRKLFNLFESVHKEKAFGNGRYVRNIFERSVNKQALRLSTDIDLTRDELSTIETSDIEGV